MLEDGLKPDAVYPYGLSDDSEMCFYGGNVVKDHGDDDMEMETLEYVRIGDQQRREACISEELRQAGGGGIKEQLEF